ncbi:regulator of G-protein signaling 7 [Hetaerina americana]|uniref:regulator of G-protein signaling 7 n=1 Tax=Hetaerina americana TaxID=62018 RepID=UPI003A7F5032
MVTMSSDKSCSRRKTESNNGQAAGTSNTNVQQQTGQQMLLSNQQKQHQPMQTSHEDTPNHIVYKKMEQIVEKMQDETTGVPVKTVKSFMSKIPSVFTGSDLVAWMMKNLDIDDQEAQHLAHLMAAHGYFFPIDDHLLTVKNDGTFYRFQTPYFWPSNSWEPENTDYAVYLCKRTMQNKTRLELADYEAENLARLQKMFSRKWEFIFMQAEAQSKVDKKRDKLERKVLDSQERAFWDVHRPVPGSVNTTEVDIKKACRVNRPHRLVSPPSVQPITQQPTSENPLAQRAPAASTSPSVPEKESSSEGNEKAKEGEEVKVESQAKEGGDDGSDQNTGTAISTPTSSCASDIAAADGLRKDIEGLRHRLDRRNFKVSKVAEAYISYFEQYVEYDPFFTATESPNPWLTDNPDYWEQEKTAKEIPTRRVKRWAFGLHELLRDPVGRDHFIRFLDKEFSGENLKFWEAVQDLKSLPQSEVQARVEEIWSEFLAPDASCPINVDSRSNELTKRNMKSPDRWTFDTAAAHVYHLMKSDSYSRYLRSEMYKEFLSGAKKKTSVKGIRSIVSFSARKDNPTS